MKRNRRAWVWMIVTAALLGIAVQAAIVPVRGSCWLGKRKLRIALRYGTVELNADRGAAWAEMRRDDVTLWDTSLLPRVAGQSSIWRWSIRLPTWPLFGGLVLVLLLARDNRRRARLKPGPVLCAKCGYALAGLREPICPECGAATSVHES